MRAERYSPSKHDEMLSLWCKLHRKKPFPKGWLSDTGFIVPGIIAAFLYRTNSKLGFVECIISNPNSSAEERQTGLDLVLSAIEREAKAAGIIALQGQSAIASIKSHGKRNAWIVSEPKYRIFVKPLENLNE